MGLRLSFDFYGDQQIDRTLARFAHNAQDATEAWEAMAVKFGRLMQRQFNSEGRHASGGWSPLSPKYAAWKARHYPGAGILERTGALRRSLVRRPFGVEEIRPQSMAIGSDVAYGAFHQHGGGRLPQRRPVELTESARRDWVQILQRHIISNGQTR